MTEPAQTLFSMNGKVALVTGASSGLGAHFSRVLAAAGAQVIVGARRRERLEALVAEIVADGGDAIAVSLDVTSEASVHAALDEAESRGCPVDVLVNNAGVADSRHTLKVDESSWDFIMDTNLKAAWRIARELAAQALLMLTDVDAVYRDWGEPDATAIRRISPQEIRNFKFAAGSMAPKVEAACEFAERTGGIAGIGRLQDAEAILAGEAGTLITTASSRP